MLEVMTVIDGILKLAPVRWGLLVLAIGLSVSVTVQTIRFIAAENQLDAEKGRNASLTAGISLQSEAVKQAGRDMEVTKKRLLTANQKAADLRRQLENRKVEIREVVLQGDCPDMVQQVLDEVRK